MSYRYARGLPAVPAAVLLAVLGITVAYAATTWTVRPGGTIRAGASKAALTDTTTGSILRCSPASMSGALRRGSGLPGTGIGSMTMAAFHCSGPFGFPKLTPRGLPWHLNLTSYDASTNVSRGTISPLSSS